MTDVLVVGAGPAGLATAIEARLRGLSVRVLDRRSTPLDKPCGEGLMPDGLERLSAMGVRLAPSDYRAFDGISYIDGELRARGHFPGSSGAGVRRTRLHEAMMARVRALKIPVQWRTRVEGVDPDHGRIQTRLETGSVSEIEAGFVVVADGLRSPLRAALGLEGRPQARGAQRFGASAHYGIKPWSRSVEVYWGDQAEAYVTPLAEGEVGVAMLWGGRKASFQKLLAEFPELYERLREAPMLSKVQGVGPLRQRATTVTRGRVALVGDAAGYVDAITGEGLSIAFHQAEALAQALADGDLSSYPARCRSIVRQPNLMTELLLFLESRPRLRRRAMVGLSRDPDLFDRFLAVHCRACPPSSLLAMAPRLTWSLVRG